MGRTSFAFYVLVVTAASAARVSAQGSPQTQITVDASVLGVSASYARLTGERTLYGVNAGAGGNFIGPQFFTDTHFSEGRLLGLAHGGAFLRRRLSDRSELDAGLQVGAMLHSTDYDDDVALVLFGGPYTTFLAGWKNLKVGPRLQMVYAYESGERKGLGLLLDPVARFSFRF